MVQPQQHIPGVIGAGSFGTAVANILAENGPVRLLAKNTGLKAKISESRASAGQSLHDDVVVIDNMEELAATCSALFPIIPSQDFRAAMASLKPFLTQDHILIHGTKGLDVDTENLADLGKEHVFTMSEVIRDVTGLSHIGCMAGPNLAREIAEGKPAATVIAGNDERTRNAGVQLLRTSRFQVLTSDDLLGIELCGVIKNIMAIAAGSAAGLELGENARSLLINRAMVEMIHIGQQLGAGVKPFLGAAGMGDLMATCNSPKSRNYTVGFRLAKGESFEEIRNTMEETAEGVNTTKIIHHLSEKYGWKTPITRLVYKVLFEDYPVEDSITALMKLPLKEDIDFL